MFWEVYALDRQEYLKSLTEQIRTKRARTMVAEEVEAHIEDQKQDFMAHGLGEEEAESMAVVEMGDPVEAGVKLDRVHRPKMEWTVLMAILIISIWGNGRFVTDYQVHRLEALITGEHWDYTRGAVADVANAAKDSNSSKWHESQSSGKIEVTDPYNGATEVEAVTLYNYARNDYIWTYLFHYFGNVKGVFLVVVFAVFMALLLRMAVKQKNRLGYMLSIGCVIFLILQSLFYIGVNAGLYPISGNYMPFLSHGNMTMMITYFYMGILLSVYRNSNIVKN